jgi:TRAP-type C4-dicarboxylate transport system permease small subunit
MGQRLLRILVTRAALVALPFLLWFAWREVARRTGREMGSTPWAWLAAAAGMLVGLSLMATAVFHTDNRGERYVPAEVNADGRIAPGHFEK